MENFTLEEYKKIIVNVSLIFSTITMCFSILSIILAYFFSQNEDAVCVDLNINLDDASRPKTYLYIQKDSDSFLSPNAEKTCTGSLNSSIHENVENFQGENTNEKSNCNNLNYQEIEEKVKLLSLNEEYHTVNNGHINVDEVDPNEKQNKVIRIIIN
ncbi:hypothetical protein, conserved [Plasmodium gonderi]|uniref:Uncharacterized protein n=1 Tax=Plasmodium gonderi TaxID=77519 RepID=A0A1Y1JLK4_PLAGO|nr:hypothetical protein, conserved [Plasmodium gonderi]GAW82355.1 hypothetical protein, conserved [Plasmodium gonderi]